VSPSSDWLPALRLHYPKGKFAKGEKQNGNRQRPLDMARTLLEGIVRLVGSDRKLTQIELGDGGKIVDRAKDGTFHVDQTTAKELVKSGDFAVAGTTFRSAQGYRCQCGFVSVFRDRCGKCGSTDLVPEEE